MKTYFLSFLLVGMGLYLNAQNQAYAPSIARSYNGNFYVNNNNDPEDKEISVITGILSKLVQQEFNNGDTAINIERVKGAYLPGSGVLFTITQRMPFYSRPMLLGINGRGYATGRYGLTTTAGQQADVLELGTPAATGTNNAAPKPRSVDRTRGATGGQQPLYGVLTPNPIGLNGDTVQMYTNGQNNLQTYTTNGNVVVYNPTFRGGTAKIQDSVFAAKIPRMKKVLEKFLAEYTILLSKLKPEEKIWVTWNIKEDYWGYDQGRSACELSSRITKQDMLDLRSGKLDQAKFASQIQYSVTRCAERVSNPELEVFTAILERLYSPEVSLNLVQFGAVQSEVIGGFGYVFKMNFAPMAPGALFSARSDVFSSGIYTAQPQQKEISKEEAAQKIAAFKAEFPKQLLEYSRVLKDLKAGEMLKVDVSVTESGQVWRNTGEQGKQFSYALPQSLIRDYDTGKVKLEDAVKLIQVEEKK